MIVKRTWRVGALAVLSVVAGVPTALGATFCVGTSAELQDALMTAASNGADDVVKIRTGVYTQASGSISFAYSTAQSKAITISGGWVDFGMFNCLFQVGIPTDTVLSGSGVRQVLAMGGSPGTSGNMTLENLELFNGSHTDNGGGLRMSGSAGFLGDLVVDRVLFYKNTTTTFAGGALIGADGGTVRLTNSWFIDNTCGANSCAAEVITNYANATSPRAFIGNNTVTKNECAVGAPVTCDNGGLYVGGSARYAIFNNAFADNGGSDLRLQATVDLFNNSLPVRNGINPATSGGNINPANPGFVDSAGNNYHLLPNSPLREAGTGAYGAELAFFDYDGNPRLDDQQYDIGAWEYQNTVFRDSFEAQL